MCVCVRESGMLCRRTCVCVFVCVWCISIFICKFQSKGFREIPVSGVPRLRASVFDLFS